MYTRGPRKVHATHATYTQSKRHARTKYTRSTRAKHAKYTRIKHAAYTRSTRDVHANYTPITRAPCNVHAKYTLRTKYKRARLDARTKYACGTNEVYAGSELRALLLQISVVLSCLCGWDFMSLDVYFACTCVYFGNQTTDFLIFACTFVYFCCACLRGSFVTLVAALCVLRVLCVYLRVLWKSDD